MNLAQALQTLAILAMLGIDAWIIVILLKDQRNNP